jgi:hypothetical protein
LNFVFSVFPRTCAKPRSFATMCTKMKLLAKAARSARPNSGPQPRLQAYSYAQRSVEKSRSYQQMPCMWCPANHDRYRRSSVAAAAIERAPLLTCMCAALPFMACCSAAQSTAPSEYPLAQDLVSFYAFTPQRLGALLSDSTVQLPLHH